MQRHKFGTYEFRKWLPEELAGKPVPEHVRQCYPDPVNPKTGCFKREPQGRSGAADGTVAEPPAIAGLF